MRSPTMEWTEIASVCKLQAIYNLNYSGLPAVLFLNRRVYRELLYIAVYLNGNYNELCLPKIIC